MFADMSGTGIAVFVFGGWILALIAGLVVAQKFALQNVLQQFRSDR